MKKLLALLLVISIFASCKNNYSEKDNLLKDYIINKIEATGCKTKKVRVRHLDIKKEFWMYTRNYNVNHIDNPEFRLKNSDGTLFVAKIKQRNKFGTILPESFKVYTFDDNDSIYEYRGRDRLDIFKAAWPSTYYKIFDYNINW